MKKFTKTGHSIEINLPGLDYIVRANMLKIGNENNVYDVVLELRRVDIGKWDMLNLEHYSLTSSNINVAAYEFVMDKLADGFFKKYIEDYEYELSCFTRGNELFEQERTGD